MVYDRIRALELHRRARGKVKVFPTININDEEGVFLAAYPGSVAPGEAIVEDKDRVFEFTGKGNRLAVITDGSAICGMGNVGPLAGMPMIEGKCLLFKLFGDVNAIPLCVESGDPEELIHMVTMIAPNFGGINLEDISSPNTFTMLRKLELLLDTPVFCDDQDGTAMLVTGALLNALTVVGKKLEDARIVLCGAGAGGIAAGQLLLHAGARNLVLLNSKGILGPHNPSMNYVQEELAARTNPEGLQGGLEEVARGADVLVGLSVPKLFSGELLRTMAPRSVVFSLALPEPEITYEEAVAAGAAVVGTGLSRAGGKNQLSNILAFPGLLRGAMDVRSKDIPQDLLLAGAQALASSVDPRRLSPQNVVPDLFCDETTPRIAEAVAQKAVELHLAKNPLPPGEVYNSAWQRIFGDRQGKI